MRTILMFITLIFSFALQGQSDFDSKKLDAYLDLLEKNNKANLTVAISKGNELIYEKHAGFLSSKLEKRIDSNTKFRIGSISKTFTAVVIFQLIEEGKLAIDTKLSEFYPDFKNGDKITIAELLNHSSGIHNFTADPDFPSYAAHRKSKEELLAIMQLMPSDFEPKSKTSYSNSGYILLGLIIEKVSGKTYTQNVEERIIKKLSLPNTAYGDKIELEKNEAESMIFQGGKWIQYPLEWDMSIPFSAGALVSTPGDLNQFMHALFNNKLVSEVSIKKMQEVKGNLGHGIFPVPFYARSAFGHNGHIDSFDSGSYYFKDDDVNFTVLTSGITIGYNDILVGVLSIYFNMPYELPDYSASPIELAADKLPAYEGDFASNIFPLDIIVKVSGSTLTAQATGQNAFPLTPYSNIEFRFDAAGIVLLFGGTEDAVDYSSFVLKQGGQQYPFRKK